MPAQQAHGAAPLLDLTGVGAAALAPSGTKADLALTSWKAWKPSHFLISNEEPRIHQSCSRIWLTARQAPCQPRRCQGSCSRELLAVHGVVSWAERQLFEAYRTTRFGASHHGASLATCKKFPLRKKSASSKVTSPRRCSHTGTGTQSTHWNVTRRVHVTQGTAFQANMLAADRLSLLAMTPGVLLCTVGSSLGRGTEDKGPKRHTGKHDNTQQPDPLVSTTHEARCTKLAGSGNVPCGAK